MKYNKNISPVSPDNTKLKKRKTNWHEAAYCALQIELKDFADKLEFYYEYMLGKNYFRIDTLIINKLTSEPIPKNIACNFKSYNIFEFKGIGSYINTDSYYKVITYAGALLIQINKINRKN